MSWYSAYSTTSQFGPEGNPMAGAPPTGADALTTMVQSLEQTNRALTGMMDMIADKMAEKVANMMANMDLEKVTNM